jgi:DNA-binding transcriptional MerR regulator
MRYTVKDIAKESGFSKDTIRKHADAGLIPYKRDMNQWRIFNERSIEAAKELAGIQKQEPATGSTARVGFENT